MKQINLDKYSTIFFDADRTLFSFDGFQGLDKVFSDRRLDFSRAKYDEYQQRNKALWDRYERSEISSEDIKSIRFIPWEDELGMSSLDINTAYMDAMALVSEPLLGARELLSSLKGRVNIGIITNGMVQLQQVRLDRTGFSQYIDQVIVSEAIGKAKPHPDIFHHALSHFDHPHPSKVLMVGDSITSDIKGGQAAKLDTCWVTPAHSVSEIIPTYRVDSLLALHELLQCPV